jgi:hypothetical protein
MARKAKRKKPADIVARFVRPTEAREAQNDFESAGAAVRVVPVIETLHKAGHLTQAEYDALNHYRNQAHRAEDDCAQSGTLAPERMMGGDRSPCGSQIPVGVLLATPAIIECARLERELGSLLDIARAVAVDDVSLTRWAIQTSGGIEVRRQGKVTEIKPRCPKAMEYARIDLKFAAARIRP